MKYIIYGSKACTYCNSAKDLLEFYGEDYDYVDIDEDEEVKDFIVSSGYRTVPQIFMDLTPDKEVSQLQRIGGYDDLCKHIK